jgi:hypothetical protein
MDMDFTEVFAIRIGIEAPFVYCLGPQPVHLKTSTILLSFFAMISKASGVTD